MDKGKCIHFNGIMTERCKAGHKYIEIATPVTAEQLKWHNDNYPDLDPVRTAIAKRIPCFIENDVHTCPDYREPTDEELKKYEQDISTMMSSFIASRSKIVEHIKEKEVEKQAYRGQIPCPICEKGQLHFTYTGSYNKHIHAKCTTEGCVSWME